MNKPAIRAIGRALLLLALLVPVAEAASTKRVLVIHSWGRDFAPFNTVALALRTELARELKQPVAFHEVSLDSERSGEPGEERPFVEFLREHHGAAAPDLVLVLGASAMRFYLRHREDLFGEVPLLVTGIEQRRVPDVELGARDRVVSLKMDVPAIAGNILEVLPETRTLAVVMGSSTAERLWLGEFKNELAPLAGRVGLVWLHDLTLEELRSRAAALPPGSAILYVYFTVDANGVTHENERALAAVRAAASAPVFGVYDSQLGAGIVGGPLLGLRRMGERAGQVARRMLEQESDDEATHLVLEAGTPVFDWRELERWGIPKSRLPALSEVRFQPPSVWEQHRALILAGAGIVLLQAALITALLFQKARRRRAGKEAVGLSGRLLSAHGDERKRLARELHDDLTQRLARLSIDAGQLERSPGADARMAGMRQELVRLSEDVHSLSYRLHPSMLDDLGLVEALKAECDRVARHSALRVDVDARGVPDALSVDTSLCLFRVAQEALNNAVRHACASVVTVLLSPSGKGLQLAVSDNGSGFDPARSPEHPSLGLASMRERVRLLQGQLDIESTPGRGTTVVAWVPA